MPIDPNFDFALGDTAAYRSSLFEDADQIVTRSAGGTLDTEDQTAFDALRAEVEKCDQDIANRKALAALADRGQIEAEDAPEAPSYELPRVNVNLGGTRDIFDLSTTRGLHGQRLADEYRSRAMVAVEKSTYEAMTDSVREDVAKMLANDGAQFDAEGEIVRGAGARAKHVLQTGSPQYVKEFHQFMANPSRGPSDFMRALNEGSTGAGGAIVPFFLDPTIILTNAGTVSPIRNLATIKQITTNVWHGVTSAGVTAEWIGESTEVSDASPVFAQPSITTFKADAYVQASMELIADSAISGEITTLLADAKGRLEGTTFATGTGTGQPRGIITACSGGVNQINGSSGAAGAADLVAADIFAVANALPARYRTYGSNPAWLASFLVINKIRMLNGGTSAFQSTFWADFTDDTPSKLIGFPVMEASDMDSTIVSGSNDDILLYGDISQYYIVDRIGMEVVFNPVVVGANRRPTGESGWAAFWRTGADMVNSGAARVLMI